MRSATKTRHQAQPAKRHDAWDEDDLGEDDEPGPSWTKAYVGGLKVRQYAVLEGARAGAEPQQPSTAWRHVSTKGGFALPRGL